MRSHAKASTAGSTEHKATVLLALLAALAATLLAAAPALAATVTDRPLLFSFDGSDTSAGTIEEMRGGIAVDESSGNVYALDLTKMVVDKFDADGAAEDFSALGSSSLDGGETPGGAFALDNNAALAVDDSAVNTGRLYLASGFVPGAANVYAFSPAGTFLWRLQVAPNGACSAAVDTAGHLWLGDRTNDMVREYASSGSPPAEIGSFAASSPCDLDVAANGDVYVIGEGNLRKYVGGVLSSTVDTGVAGVAVDQSSPTGHVFSIHGESVKEFDSGGSLIGTFGAGVLYESNGVAYNPTLDRVYVGQFADFSFGQYTNTIKALGPVTTGTVPDPASEAASEVDVSKAKLNGKVNPQSVPNAYFFEWKEGTGSSWRKGQASTPQSLAEDSLEHPVSFDVTELKGNTTYQARVVALNTDTGLRSVAGPITFTTAAPAAPAVTIADPAAVTATSAEITGTVNPEEDFGTTWRLQTSTDPACASSFSDRAAHNLQSEANSPQPVSEGMTGLLPNQHYCVRISAVNGGGETNSETKEFTTNPVVPSRVETSFVAPRTDTTARLNGLVDPEGANATFPLTYRFEYSEDGGSTWTSLGDREYSGGARTQILLADDLTGLTPNTEYSYRFSAESDAGPASPQGAVRTFTTRTSAEMALPQRGYELVNTPDKGNQNVFSIEFGPATAGATITPDGNRALWSVLAGAPGAPSGTKTVFLAERTAGGWKSRSLAPPAAQQVGGGSLAYIVRTATPDFSQFAFTAEPLVLGQQTEWTLVHLDAQQNQTILRSHAWGGNLDEVPSPRVDMTADGTHILAVNGNIHQLEDLGAGAPEVVSLMPDGTPSSCGLNSRDGASFVGGRWGAGPAVGASAQEQSRYHMIDRTDASLVYFEAKPNGECSKPWGLYLRDRDAEETTLIDPGTATKEVNFIAATPDAQHAYFATFSQLDPADANQGGDVYRWGRESEETTCLTCVVPEAGLATEGFVEVIAPVQISEDFSHIYFESAKELIPGRGTPGVNSVYVLSEGEVRYVTESNANHPVLDNAFGLNQLSSDGEIFAWHSVESGPATADPVLGGANQVYLYDDRNGSVECVSCDHDGVTTFGSSNFSLSADGSTLAFVTAQQLVPLDVNKGEDVYEWRNGSRGLITDGVTEFPTELAAPRVKGTDADGSNILFSVTDPGLTGFEQDGLANLYVARIGGGFEPPAPVIHCDGDSCQGPLLPAPGPGASASANFSGHGNLAPQVKRRKPCAKKRGKAKQRCIRKHKRRAHANRGGAK